MFASKGARKKIAAESVAKKKSTAINMGKIGAMKKPVADNTSVKSPIVKKTMAQASKESVQGVKKRIADVIAKPTSVATERAGYKRYEKGNMVVRLPYKSNKKK